MGFCYSSLSWLRHPTTGEPWLSNSFWRTGSSQSGWLPWSLWEVFLSQMGQRTSEGLTAFLLPAGWVRGQMEGALLPHLSSLLIERLLPGICFSALNAVFWWCCSNIATHLQEHTRKKKSWGVGLSNGIRAGGGHEGGGDGKYCPAPV